MADSITKIEIDDVLSSIRRLVSEESVAKAVPTPAEISRFVLTPALRVPDTVALTPHKTEDISQTPELADVLATAAKASESQTQTEPEPAPEPVVSNQREHRSAEFDAMEQAWKSELARVAEAKQETTEDTPATEPKPETEETGVAQSLEQRIAELENSVGQSEGDWEPDGTEPEASGPPKRHIFEVVDNTKDPEFYDQSPRDDDSAPIFSHKPVTRAQPYLLSESVAPTTPDDAELPTPEPVPSVDPPSAPADADIVEDDDVFLDVETLRKMVTEVVRDELRGKLGESITRNVRRMMQQEISQAISQHSLDNDSDS